MGIVNEAPCTAILKKGKHADPSPRLATAQAKCNDAELHKMHESKQGRHGDLAVRRPL